MFAPIRDDSNINFTDLTLTLLFRCNYRCPSCLVGDKLTSKEALSFEDAVGIIDSAAKLRSFNSIAFVGGEPFLVYPLMVRLSTYIFERYGRVALSASTNSYWAKSVDVAQAKLKPLVDHGLHSLLLSWDDFHAQFGNIRQVAHAITACNALGVEPTVQNIVLPHSTSIGAIKAQLAELCDISKVEWTESCCTPVGLGADIPAEQHSFLTVDDLDYGGCTAGQILNIEANGDAKPCCGSGLMASGLTMGNIYSEATRDIVRRSSVDPVFNSLTAYKGPKHLVAALRAAGRGDLVPERVTDVCDACFKITDNPEAMQVLRAQLAPQAMQLLLNRVIGEAYENLSTISHHADGGQSVFTRVPNIAEAGSVAAGRLGEGRRSTDTPQVITDFVERCAPALIDWRNLDILRDKAGGESVRVAIKSKAAGSQVEMTLGTYIDRVMHPAYAIRGRDMYLSEQPIPKALMADFQAAHRAAEHELAVRAGANGHAGLPKELMMFCGRFTYTDCHEHGGYDALMIQVAGDKEVLLYAPTEANIEALYIDEERFRNWSPVHMWAPNLEQFPKFANSRPIYVKVLEGQALFIPDGWYHAVASIGDGLTITSTLFSQSLLPRRHRNRPHKHRSKAETAQAAA